MSVIKDSGERALLPPFTQEHEDRVGATGPQCLHEPGQDQPEGMLSLVTQIQEFPEAIHGSVPRRRRQFVHALAPDEPDRHFASFYDAPAFSRDLDHFPVLVT